MDIVIPRIPRTYGASMRRQDSKALAQFIQKAAIGEDVVLKSKGTQLFSYCYIADVATALFVIASRGIRGDAYNIADGQSDIALRRLAELVADATGVNLTFELPGDIEKTGYSAATKALMNASKLKSLGWAPAYDIESGLRRTIAIWQGTQDMNALSR
jgi:nucleoside-diphosphate-sugar epimerase